MIYRASYLSDKSGVSEGRADILAEVEIPVVRHLGLYVLAGQTLRAGELLVICGTYKELVSASSNSCSCSCSCRNLLPLLLLLPLLDLFQVIHHGRQTLLLLQMQ